MTVNEILLAAKKDCDKIMGNFKSEKKTKIKNQIRELLKKILTCETDQEKNDLLSAIQTLKTEITFRLPNDKSHYRNKPIRRNNSV